MRWYLVPLLFAGPVAAQRAPAPADHARWHALIAAEDARATTPASLDVLTTALADGSPWIRAYAARALGRLDRPELVLALLPALDDADAVVRARTAWAIAQSLHGERAFAHVRTARDALHTRLAAESDASARAALLEALGRIPAADPETVADAGTALAANLAHDNAAIRLGAARGLQFLARQRTARRALPDTAVAMIRRILSEPTAGEIARRTRVAAAQTLNAAMVGDLRALTSMSSDPDPSVRRESIAAALLLQADLARDFIFSKLLDPDPTVRYAALSALRRNAAGVYCAPVERSLQDLDEHVVLAAVSYLATCAAHERLESLVGSLAPDGSWHRATAALLALAAVDSVRAAAHMDAFVRHTSAFVRAHAAAAAGVIGAAGTLRTLAADPDPNVRTAAVSALARVEGRDADGIYIAQLTQDDGQLLMTAAAALEGTTDPDALPALLEALDRLSAQRRETSRDPRMALLERIDPLGSAANAPRLQPRLRDFDPVIAARAADIIGRWTGSRPEPAPEPLPRLELPTVQQLLELERARVTIEVEDGGVIELRLLPFDAPTNAWRFARLARNGWYDGLTVHRVVPNFVIQGGSPNANEYAGDGPFTRDELGQPHWRGTVGLSTRGRDTGDAQIFINLVDNLRLDPDYTVFAEVVAGMDVADRMLEGARIRAITVRSP